MSTLKVDTIQKADGTGSLSVPAESGNLVTTAAGSVESAMTTQFGRRNLIINGAMQVAQRGTSKTGISNGYDTADRIGTWSVGGVYDSAVVADAPDGFTNSFKITTTTADTLSAGDRLNIYQKIEGQNVQQLASGSSAAKQFTLSFWVKSSVTGTYSAEIYQYDGAAHFTKNYTISSANTWEYKTLTYTANTASAVANDNTQGIALWFWLRAGSDYNSGTASNTWNSDNTERAIGQTADVGAVLNSTFQITGVQLEVGSVATPFEHRSYGEELALCQRYYFRIDEGNGTPSTSTRLPAIFTNETSSRCLTAHYPPVELRATPSLYVSSVSHFTVIGTGTATNVGLGGSATNRTLYYFFDHGSSTTQYETRQISVNTSSGGWLAFDAEL